MQTSHKNLLSMPRCQAYSICVHFAATALLACCCLLLDAPSLLAQNVPLIKTPNVISPPVAITLPAIPAINPALPAKVITPSVIVTPQQPKTSVVVNNAIANTIPKSLFLSDDDYIHISDALANYNGFLASRSGVDANSSTADSKDMKPGDRASQKTIEQSFTYPQFFLQSLVYHSPSDWLVIINGQKITPQTSSLKADIRVAAIDIDRVLIKWKPVNIARVTQTWDKLSPGYKNSSENVNMPVQISFDNKESNTFPNVPVSFDKENKIVTFVLRPNQTFSSYGMSALEGKVASVTIQNTPSTANKKDTDIAIAQPKEHAFPDTVDDSDTGLNGLMKTLQKHPQPGTDKL